MNQHRYVIQLAKSDFATALQFAGSIENVRQRIQAFGCVARYAPAKQIPRVIAAVDAFAGTSSDIYGDVMGLAYPLRALHETGNAKMIPALLRVATELSACVTPAASRAEALVHLIHAVLPAGLALSDPAISTLTSIRDQRHWRIVRAFVQASLLVNTSNRQRALEVAAAIAVSCKRDATLGRIRNGEQMTPRPFFW